MNATTTHEEEAIARLRESALFYLKLDVGFLAGIATLASVLKLDATQLVSAAVEYREIVNALLLLIALAIFIEFSATLARNGLATEKTAERFVPWFRRIISFCYIVQVFWHMWLMAYASGALVTYLRCLAGNCNA